MHAVQHVQIITTNQCFSKSLKYVEQLLKHHLNVHDDNLQLRQN